MPPSPSAGHAAGATFHLHPFDRRFQYSNHGSSQDTALRRSVAMLPLSSRPSQSLENALFLSVSLGRSVTAQLLALLASHGTSGHSQPKHNLSHLHAVRSEVCRSI